MTASVIDSREFVAARRRAKTELLVPPGPKVALTGGTAFNDHTLIWNKLDQVQARHPDMVLLHGGSDRGAELIAAKWADTRKVPQIAFKPDWTRHAKAAPFKRNDAILEVLPIGVIVLPGSGIQDNLADKAKKQADALIACGAAEPAAGGKKPSKAEAEALAAAEKAVADAEALLAAAADDDAKAAAQGALDKATADLAALKA